LTHPKGQRLVRRVTSSDVAKYAGVSQATVSRAFMGNGLVTEETREKILSAARSLNYVPNSFARSLITNQSDIVAILIGDLHNPFYAAALEEFSLRLQELGKHVLVFNAAPGREDDAILRMLEYQVDGLIITAATISMQMTSVCIERRIPVVLFNRYVPGFLADSVYCDNAAGGKLAADTLRAAGAARYGVIYGDSGTTTNDDRLRGFTQGLAEYGIGDVALHWGHYTYEGGYRAAEQLLKLPQPPDALFCINDIMALGAIDAARAMGLAIPGDVMIVGFDDIPEAARPPYRLTTIRQPIDRMIDETMGLLRQDWGEGPKQPISRILEGKLIARATTLG